MGFTWYSLTDQVDWDVALREEKNKVHPVGLYDLDRNVRPVGEAYKKLIDGWRHVLPTQSVCLQVPVVMPHHYHPAELKERQEEAAMHSGAGTSAPANQP